MMQATIILVCTQMLRDQFAATPHVMRCWLQVLCRWTRQIKLHSWWRHQMETFSALLALCSGNSPVTGEFPSQRPVTRSYEVFFDLRLSRRLSKQWWGWWFETPSYPLWRHCNGLRVLCRWTRRIKLHLHGQMEVTDTLSPVQSLAVSLFPRYWPFVRGIHRLLMEPLTKVQKRGLWYFLCWPRQIV